MDMSSLRVGSRWFPPLWLLPTAIISSLVVGVAALAFGIGLTLLAGVDREVEGVGIEGGRALNARAIEDSADHLRLFVAGEELLLANGATGPIPLLALLAANANITVIEGAAARLDAQDPEKTPSLSAGAGDLRAAFLTYVNTRDASSLVALGEEAIAASVAAGEIEPVLLQATVGHFLSVEKNTHRLRVIGWMLASTLVPAVAGLIFFMGVRDHRILRFALAGTHSLADSNAVLKRRNQQFEGLYHVVTEVTETLSMKYVTETTVREARKLVNADMVVLRTLQDGMLILAGTSGTDKSPVQEDLDLDGGITSRVAKRARIMRASPEASGEFLDPESCGMKTGVVLPLTVGARVVGTISCWSAKEDAFDDDDLRVLELMASQVATAIAAADVHEERGRQAFLDPLTQLPNRRQLTQDVRFEFDSAVRRGRPMAVAMIDIDHFKVFNDTHGHHAGDVALQRVAAVLAGALRREDRVYRYGGEEFAIVFDSLDRAAAKEACERLRTLVVETTACDNPGSTVTISIGLALAGVHSDDFAELLIAADEALYAAKEAGRDRVVVASSLSPAAHPRAA
jgi:diguanylate cyclase (GGDEF)-like protein